MTTATAYINVGVRPYEQNKHLWDRLLAEDCIQHPFGYPADQAYMKAYHPSIPFSDISILATADETPIAGLQLTRWSGETGDTLDFFGRPAMLRVNGHQDFEFRNLAQERLAECLIETISGIARPMLRLQELPDCGALSAFAQTLLSRGFSAHPIYEQIIDLTRSEDALHADIRRRYKSHINWGQRNLAIDVQGHTNLAPAAIEEFHNLHVEVSGRETRSPETWLLQETQIRQGQGFLVTGRIDGKLVTGALFTCTSRYCYYGVGASIREMFDKPLSHAIMWRGICEAKRLGCQFFDIGELVDLYPSGYSDKEKSIADFKRGFGGAPTLRLVLNCSRGPKLRAEDGIETLR